jgi:copper chaperone CopZ
MKTETTVTLTRLNCSGCVRNVTKALQTLPELEVLQADTSTKTVRVRYPQEQVSLEQIRTVLSEAGYPAVQEQSVS